MGVYYPRLTTFFKKKFNFNLGVAMVAMAGGSVHAEPVRRSWRWPWPQRAQTLTTALTARRRAACRGHVTPWLAHLLARERPSWPSLWGVKKLQEKFHVRNGRARAGADGVVLGACRGVAGGALRLGQGAGSTRIAQGRRVGRLQPKVHSLGVAGQFGDVVE